MNSPYVEELMNTIDLMLAGETPPTCLLEEEEYGQLLAIAKNLIEFDFYVLNPGRPKLKFDMARYGVQELDDEELDMVAGGIKPEALDPKLPSK